ncbi:MAG: branched-chain amino acid ABC transporter permease [Alphaproteobacteria bacterium]|nr:branched-chain amino acid ABC transporter permease [Alphaproteobacteria bacterium]
MRDAPLPVALAVFAGLGLVPFVLGDYWTGQLARYVLFGLFAMSLALVWGRAGILCFGQAMFFGIGGYAMATVTLGTFAAVPFTAALPALVLAVAVAAAAALLVALFLFWGAGIGGAYLAAVTLALAAILEQAVRGWYGLGADNGLSGVPPLPLGDNPWDPRPIYFVVLAVAAAVYFGLLALLASRFGTLLTALRTNPERLAHLGYSVVALRVAVFTLGGAIAGLAGALFVATDAFASPSLIGFALSAEVLIWVALGGRSVLLAAFLAAILIRVAEAYLSETLGPWWLLTLGTLFMVSVAAVPNGVLATPLLWLQGRLRRTS